MTSKISMVFVSNKQVSTSENYVCCQPLRRIVSGQYAFPRDTDQFEFHGLYNSSNGTCAATIHYNSGDSDHVIIMPNEYIVLPRMPSAISFAKFQWLYCIYK